MILKDSLLFLKKKSLKKIKAFWSRWLIFSNLHWQCKVKTSPCSNPGWTKPTLIICVQQVDLFSTTTTIMHITMVPQTEREISRNLQRTFRRKKKKKTQKNLYRESGNLLARLPTFIWIKSKLDVKCKDRTLETQFMSLNNGAVNCQQLFRTGSSTILKYEYIK